MDNFGEKIGLAIIICLVDILESISIATALATRNGYELKPTQELTGLGVANLVGAAFNCYTTTGTWFDPRKNPNCFLFGFWHFFWEQLSTATPPQVPGSILTKIKQFYFCIFFVFWPTC